MIGRSRAAVVFVVLVATLAAACGADSTPDAGPAPPATAEPAPPRDAQTPAVTFALDLSRPPRVGASIAFRLDALDPDGAATPIAAEAARPVALEFTLPGAESFRVDVLNRRDGAAATAWFGAVEFPAPGAWRTAVITGEGETPGPTVTVVPNAPDPPSLARPYDGLPLPALIARIGVFRNDGSDARVLWDARDAGFGWLADPLRAVFVQRRNGADWVVAGDPVTGDVTPLFQAAPANSRLSLAAAPDGRALSLHVRSGPSGADLKLYDAPSGRLTAIGSALDGPIRALAWAPDSSALLVITNASLLLVAPTGAVFLRRAVDGELHPKVQWAPDAGFALILLGAAGDRDGAVLRVDPRNGSVDSLLAYTVDLRPADASLGVAAIAPDSQRIAIAWVDRTRDIVRLAVLPAAATGVDAPNATQFALPDPAAPAPLGSLLALAWSPDGERLTYSQAAGGDATVHLLNPRGGDDRVLLRRQPGAFGFYLRSLVWSNAGDRLTALLESCLSCDAPAPVSRDTVTIATGDVERDPIEPGSETKLIPGTDLRATPQGLVLVVTGADSDRRLLFALPATDFRVAAAPDGEHVLALLTPGQRRTVFAIRPDGSGRGELPAAVDLVTGDIDRVDRASSIHPSLPDRRALVSLSPDGAVRFVATAGGAWLLDADGNFLGASALTPLAQRGAIQGELVAWAPDGSAVAYRPAPLNPAGVNGVIVMPADGSGAYQLLDASATLQLLGWSQDGRIVFAVVRAGP